MNASAVHPLHFEEQRVPAIRCCDKPACGVPGMQAGGLAAQSVTVLWGQAPFFLAPVPIPCASAQRDRHRRRRWSQSLTLLQWIERNEPS
ncbi:MAG: hypothetical protein V3S25_03740 [Nitrospirales bacterium]